MDNSLYQLLDDGATLVTASRHLAHVLVNAFNDQARQQGRSVWRTPRILPWAVYLRLACQQQREHVTGTVRLLSDSQSLMLWDGIITDFNERRAADARLLNPSQTARTAARSWQRMHQYGMALTQIAGYPTDEAQAFAAWAQEFVHRTAQHGWLDTARFAGWLLDTGFVPDTPIITYGFEQLTPDIQRLCDYWQQHADGVTHESIVNQGVQHWPLPDLRAQLGFVPARDADAELTQAAWWARQQLEAGKQRIGVVVPHLAQQAEQVQRRFTEVFAPAQRCIDVSSQPAAFHVVATPALDGYALVDHALSLLQLMLGKGDLLQVGKVLRSPHVAGYEQEADQRACLDVQARESRREEWDIGLLAVFAAKGNCPQLAAVMQAAATAVRDQRQAALPSLWTERFTHWLQLCGWARGRVLDSTEQQVQNKFRQVLGELSALDELLGRIRFDVAVSVLRDACRMERFAPEQSDQPVTIIAADSVSGMQFDALWVMGLHAGDWPPPPEPDAFIPLALQRASAVPQASAAATLKASQALLSRLLGSASHVVLSWPTQADDEALRVSPLLEVLDGWRTQAELSAPKSSVSANLSPAAQWFAARPLLEMVVDERAPPAVPAQVRGGSRVLELQSRCPFRAQTELRLGATPFPGVSPAIEPQERGVLVHRVLAEVWQQIKDSRQLQQLNLDEYADAVRQIAARHAQQVLPGDTPHRQRLASLEVAQCTRWVMALLAKDREREPFRVQRAEQREHIEVAGLPLRIQLDRMDVLDNGAQLLIDYKTGDSKPGEWLDREPGRPRSPQLPLYAIAHREQLDGIAFAVLRPGSVEYRGLARREGIAEGIRGYASLRDNQRPAGVNDWDALLVHWQHIMASLAQQHLDGVATVTPLINECVHCHLKSLCRVRELQVPDEVMEGSDE